MADKWRIDLNWIEDNSNYTSEKKFISWYGWGEKKKKNDYIKMVSGVELLSWRSVRQG